MLRRYRLNWCAEVNPRNGSAKFFGWGDQPIPIDTAKKIGEQIHEVLRQKGILGSKDRLGVFPFNHPQVLLPMRIDKVTIIDSGLLPICTRKRRDYDLTDIDDYEAEMDSDETEIRNNETARPTFDYEIRKVYEDAPPRFKLVPYETYSVLAFWQWLRRGGHYSERVLFETLKHACAKLPDVVVPVVTEPEKPQEEPLPEVTGNRPKRHLKGADNPNSFERQHEALLVFCRQSKRVVSLNEALAYIKGNRLFTGAWEDNLARRRSSDSRWRPLCDPGVIVGRSAANNDQQQPRLGRVLAMAGCRWAPFRSQETPREGVPSVSSKNKRSGEDAGIECLH